MSDERFVRRTFSEVDLNQIAENVNVYVKSRDRKTKIIAVVKADAYGHGAIKIGETIFNVSPMLFSSVVMGAFGCFLKKLFLSHVWYCVCVIICVIVYFTVLFMFPKTRRQIFELPFAKKFFKTK